MMFLSAENNDNDDENDVIVLDDDSDICDLSECIFCSKKLTSQSEFKFSKLLQCLHAICQNCYNVWDEKIDKQCTICGFFSKKKEVADNKILVEMVFEDCSSSNKDVICTIHNDAPVTHWCYDCAEFICQECVDHHRQLKSTQKHVIKSRKEHLEGKSAVQRSIFPCRHHPENDLTIVCHTCKKMTCRDCQLEVHKDHKYDFISDSVTNAKTELFDCYKKVEYNSIILHSALKKISEREAKIEVMKKSIVSDIKKEFDLLQELLKKRCESLMLSAVEKANEKLEDCEINKSLLKKNINLLDHCVKFVKFVLYSSSDAVLFYSKDFIVNHLKRISFTQSIPNCMDVINLKFSPANVEELRKKIDRCGIINDSGNISGIDKKYLYSFYNSLISVHKLNVESNQIKEPSGSIDVEVTTSSGAHETRAIPAMEVSAVATHQHSMESTSGEFTSNIPQITSNTPQIGSEPPQQQWHIPETMHISNKLSFNNADSIGNNIKKVRLTLHNNSSTQPITNPSCSNTTVPSADSIQCTESFDEIMNTINEMENREKNLSQKTRSLLDHPVTADFQNDSWCSVCLKGGEVVCCSNCPKVFHPKCHIPEISLPTNNFTFPIQSLNWRCLLCQDIPPLTLATLMNHEEKLEHYFREKKIANRLLLELYCQVDASTPFRFPTVTGTHRSVCLADIKNNLATGKYSDITLFVRDVRHMFACCFHYEQQHYLKLTHARSLQEIFNRLLLQFVPYIK